MAAKSNVQMAPIQVASGYESQQARVAQRRKLAQIMLERGLADDPNMRSWVQVLGKMAQTWAGKSMDSEASKMEGDIRAQQTADYNTARQGFLADAGSLTPQQLVEKYGNNPLLQAELEPYKSAFETGLKDRQELVKFQGKYMPKGQIDQKSFDLDPTDMVRMDEQGNIVPNGPRIAAALLSQGIAPGGGNSIALDGSLPASAYGRSMPAGGPAMSPSPQEPSLPPANGPQSAYYPPDLGPPAPAGITFTPAEGGQPPVAPLPFPTPQRRPGR